METISDKISMFELRTLAEMVANEFNKKDFVPGKIEHIKEKFIVSVDAKLFKYKKDNLEIIFHELKNIIKLYEQENTGTLFNIQFELSVEEVELSYYDKRIYVILKADMSFSDSKGVNYEIKIFNDTKQ